MRLVFIGPSGCGKGTQASLLERRFLIPKLSVGDFVRRSLARDDGWGQRLRAKRAPAATHHWQPIDDELGVAIVACMVGSRLAYCLDGFPRSVAQAESTAALLRPDAVIEFFCDEPTCDARIAVRARRSDTAHKVRTRRRHETDTLPDISAALRSAGLRVLVVDAARPIEVIHSDLVARLRITPRDPFQCAVTHPA